MVTINTEPASIDTTHKQHTRLRCRLSRNVLPTLVCWEVVESGKQQQQANKAKRLFSTFHFHGGAKPRCGTTSAASPSPLPLFLVAVVSVPGNILAGRCWCFSRYIAHTPVQQDQRAHTRKWCPVWLQFYVPSSGRVFGSVSCSNQRGLGHFSRVVVVVVVVRLCRSNTQLQKRGMPPGRSTAAPEEEGREASEDHRRC